MSAAPDSSPGRLKVLGFVVASYFAGFLPLVLLGWYGLALAKILLIASLPLLLVAGTASLFFAESIVRRPLVWACGAVGAAIALSILALYALTRSWFGVASVLVAVPAGSVFYVSARRWLSPKAAVPTH